MHQSFISVIAVLQSPRNIRMLPGWLSGLYAELSANFSDFEFVLVNNHCLPAEIEAALQPLPETLRKHVFLLNLSAPVNRDNALLAGLDRANGDYTLIVEFDLAENPRLVRHGW